MTMSYQAIHFISYLTRVKARETSAWKPSSSKISSLFSKHRCEQSTTFFILFLFSQQIWNRYVKCLRNVGQFFVLIVLSTWMSMAAGQQNYQATPNIYGSSDAFVLKFNFFVLKKKNSSLSCLWSLWLNGIALLSWYINWYGTVFLCPLIFLWIHSRFALDCLFYFIWGTTNHFFRFQKKSLKK